jgi:AraC-like DNA-binding protein
MPHYREFLPAEPLRAYVECYWTDRSAPYAAERRVLPDGCIDILFYLSGRAAAHVVGTMTRALILPPGASTDVAAVRFRPGGAAPFLRLPADALTDTQADLAEVWPQGEWIDRLAAEPSDFGRAAVLETMLLRRLPGTPAVDRRAEASSALLRRETTAVEDVAARVGLTRQHLNRVFRSQIGIGVKQFARVARFQRFQKMIRARTAPSWPRLALDAGYYDQAHMIRDCKALTGLSPVALHCVEG